MKSTKPTTLKRLAVVLPRFGKSIGGGAETLVYALTKKIAEVKEDFFDLKHIEVWTTCAKDHRTWENVYAPGEYVEEGLLVRRFPVDPRDLEIFIKNEIAISQGEHLDVQAQLDWLSHSVNSSELYQYIQKEGQSYDVILFAPYLFPTSFWGPLIYPERSVLVPCLHNEPYAYQEVFEYVFSEVRALMFNAEPEMKLAADIYGRNIVIPKATVVGMGFDAVSNEADTTLCPDNPYLLYSGRKETGKNVDMLITFFEKYKEQHPESSLELLLIGSGDIDFRKELPAGVRDLGFVTEEQKEGLMKHALALCQPSVNESFSIVIMEAWLRGTPVIVNERCAVTKHHVLESNGGFFFASVEEFCGVLDFCMAHKGTASQLGEQGSDYVKDVYAWDSVIERFRKALEKVGYKKASELDSFEKESESVANRSY